ncbi:MAG: hypothetical protein WC926_03640 [Candidatus Paceibacterota bacterium]|jgi:hypothetical protein
MYSSSPFYPSFDFGSLVIGFLIIFAILFISRNIALWYWRVGYIVDLLKDIANSLRQIAENTKK